MNSIVPGEEGAELHALLRWSLAEKVGAKGLRAAVEAAGSARALLGRQGHPALRGIAALPASEVDEVLERCRTFEIAPIGWFDARYPSVLLHLDDPPPVLFVRGTLPAPARPAVALVGARRAGDYGRRVARSLAGGVARQGVVVVSGMALGIDGEAHAGALDAGGTTVAVLGGGVERARPATHRRLYRDILERGGAVLGEWPPDTPARPFHFPRRNRILAALTKLVVVVEARDRSGALSTAAHARRLGIDVAAVPGPIDRPGHRGANALLRDGCAPILEVQDVLDLVGVLPAMTVEAPEGPRLTGDAVPVWRSLGEGASPVETVAERAGLPVARVLRALTRLEVEGWVRRERGLHCRSERPIAS